MIKFGRQQSRFSSGSQKRPRSGREHDSNRTMVVYLKWARLRSARSFAVRAWPENGHMQGLLGRQSSTLHLGTYRAALRGASVVVKRAPAFPGSLLNILIVNPTRTDSASVLLLPLSTVYQGIRCWAVRLT